MPISLTSLLEQIEDKKIQLDAMRPIPSDVARRLYGELRIIYTYHSNAIEGNSLTLSETQVILEHGITIGGKTLIEHIEATNTANAFDLIMQMAQNKVGISHISIQKVHEVVTRGILESAGQYRTRNVRIVGAPRSPPDYTKIIREMDLLLNRLKKCDYSIIKRDAYLHHQLVMIHPFIDGNGRVARLIGNLYLIQQGYPPIILPVQKQLEYYSALREADLGHIDQIVQFIAHAVNSALKHHLTVLGDDGLLIPLGELAEYSSYSKGYLSQLVRKGLLEGVKEGEVWNSSKKALMKYQESHKIERKL